MEVRINKEVRNYTESIFFGLSVRQFAFSIAACISALFAYTATSRYFGTEIISWICILSALPFGLLGFVRFQQMNAEEILKHVIWSFLLEHRDLYDEPRDLYYEFTKEARKKKIERSLEEEWLA